MAADLLTDAGTVGIIIIAVILLLREVLNYRQRGETSPSTAVHRDTVVALAEITRILQEMREDIQETHAQTKDLHHWHDAEDVDGVKRWYVRDSMKMAVEKMAEAAAAIPKLEQILLRMDKRLERLEAQGGSSA